jgi:hypothetical protein
MTFEMFLYFVVLGWIFAHSDLYRLSQFNCFYATSEERIAVITDVDIIEVSAKGSSLSCFHATSEEGVVVVIDVIKIFAKRGRFVGSFADRTFS